MPFWSTSDPSKPIPKAGRGSQAQELPLGAGAEQQGPFLGISSRAQAAAISFSRFYWEGAGRSSPSASGRAPAPLCPWSSGWVSKQNKWDLGPAPPAATPGHSGPSSCSALEKQSSVPCPATPPPAAPAGCAGTGMALSPPPRPRPEHSPPGQGCSCCSRGCGNAEGPGTDEAEVSPGGTQGCPGAPRAQGWCSTACRSSGREPMMVSM